MPRLLVHLLLSAELWGGSRRRLSLAAQGTTAGGRELGSLGGGNLFENPHARPMNTIAVSIPATKNFPPRGFGEISSDGRWPVASPASVHDSAALRPVVAQAEPLRDGTRALGALGQIFGHALITIAATRGNFVFDSQCCQPLPQRLWRCVQNLSRISPAGTAAGSSAIHRALLPTRRCHPWLAGASLRVVADSCRAGCRPPLLRGKAADRSVIAASPKSVNFTRPRLSTSTLSGLRSR